MKRFRPRFSLRVLMAIVVVSGLITWGSMVRSRRERCTWKISVHEEGADYYTSMLKSPFQMQVCGTIWNSMTPDEKRNSIKLAHSSDEKDREDWRRRVEYHLRAKAQFERAFWRPWEKLPDLPNELTDE